MGLDYLEKLSRQDVKLQNISAGALSTLIVSGEVPLSPTVTDWNITVAKRDGAPVEWRPLEPVVTRLGVAALAARAPHPHAALLFLDYLHSREDVGSLESKFKKDYLDARYSVEEYERKYSDWQSLLERLLLKKR